MDVKAKIKDILVEALKIKPEELKDEGKLYDDIGVDSTEMVEIVAALEKAFGIELEPDKINKYSSVNDIENVIQGKLGQR